jgi:hypothetical protein
VPGPQFSEADFRRALDALDICLQDYSWQPGENYLTMESVFGALKAKGITLALATELLRQLVDRKIFSHHRETIPAGPGIDAATGLPTFAEEPIHFDSLVTSRERWYGYLADHTKAPTPPLPRTSGVDTRPNSPLPPEAMIHAATRDIPRTMADMESTRELYASQPEPGQRIVVHGRLIRELGEKYGHGTMASEWAVHRLVERGLLKARYGRSDWPLWQSRDGGWQGGGSYEVRELRSRLIESTPGLWEEWHAAEQGQFDSRYQHPNQKGARNDPPTQPADDTNERPPHQPAEENPPTPPSPPAQYLWSWREILDTLNLKNNHENRARA